MYIQSCVFIFIYTCQNFLATIIKIATSILRNKTSIEKITWTYSQFYSFQNVFYSWDSSAYILVVSDKFANCKLYNLIKSIPLAPKSWPTHYVQEIKQVEQNDKALVALIYSSLRPSSRPRHLRTWKLLHNWCYRDERLRHGFVYDDYICRFIHGPVPLSGLRRGRLRWVRPEIWRNRGYQRWRGELGGAIFTICRRSFVTRLLSDLSLCKNRSTLPP